MFQEKREFDVGRLSNIPICGYLKRALEKYGDFVQERELFSTSTPDGSDAVLVKSYAAGALNIAVTILPRKDYRVLGVFVQTTSNREGKSFLCDLIESMNDRATLCRIQKSIDKDQIGVRE
jgi:hypothetical protein